MISITDALKATRRGVYLYGQAWRTAIIVDPRYRLNFFHDDLVPRMHGSSLKVEAVLPSTLTIRTERGGIIRVFGVDDYMEAMRLAGNEFTHIIWAHTPRRSSEACRGYIRAMLRSNTVPAEALRNDEVCL